MRKYSLRILYLLGFLLAISTALPTYIQSNFLEQFVNVQSVSIFFVVSNLAAFLTILYFPTLIHKIKNYRLSKYVLLFSFIAVMGMSLAQSAISAFIFFVFLVIASNLIWIQMDMFVETFSSNENTGRIRTTYFTLMNAGWIVSPVIASMLVGDSNYSLAYLVSALILIPYGIILFSKKKLLDKDTKYRHVKTLDVVKDIWKNKNLKGIFALALLLNLFYTVAVIFIPIYLHQTIGFDWTTLGIMFSVMLIPFVILELPAGIIADKYIGEKEIMATGFVVLIASLLLFFFIDSTSAFVWGGLLLLSRIGASLVEAMRETYFFKIVDVEDVDHINLFRTTGPLGYLLGSGIAALVLIFFPIQYLFILVAILMLSAFYFLSMIKDTK